MSALPIETERPHVKCACGRSYTATEFAALRFVGVQEVPGEPPYRFALRDCHCGSTIAGEIEVYDAELGGWALADEVPL